ncbi:uncharacterized protein LOC132739148 [Ruditapes philippinarum]|uniref:uncharacterized protein LOC132739148 n=1 Tax=Ruditapes philippinarum TaxID=129788 RepID=UPI00295B9679|nr:uncharacterized protein LOC132739148 [Ruditapes philippinarum]
MSTLGKIDIVFRIQPFRNESTTLTKKIKRKTELSPRISCIYDGRPIILEDDDRKRLDENCIFFKKGGFGEIFEVKGNNVFNIPLAIKKIKTNKDRSMRNLASNEMVVSRIRHQFILPLLATCYQEKEAYCEYWFISPFCENGDLLGALQLDISREEPKLEVKHRIKILFQIEKALEYLHTPVKGVRDAIIHKDVTSSNILLDGKFNARLIDFGISREKNDVTNCRSGRDTYSHDDVGKSAACEDWDYFSFGVVVREVLTSLKPEGIQHTYLKNMTQGKIMANIKLLGAQKHNKEGHP